MKPFAFTKPHDFRVFTKEYTVEPPFSEHPWDQVHGKLCSICFCEGNNRSSLSPWKNKVIHATWFNDIKPCNKANLLCEHPVTFAKPMAL